MDWRAPQNRLQLTRKRPLVRKRFLVIVALAGLAGGIIFAGVVYVPRLWHWVAGGAPTPAAKPEVVVVPPEGAAPPPPESLDKKRLAQIIGPHAFEPDEIHTFKIDDGEGHSLYVRTTLDPVLQGWAMKMMSQVKAESAALVAMSPRTGDVLAMASYRADGQAVNMALNSSFPAASLFKIVTAAAAVEKEKLTSGSTVAFDGRKHTLYRKHVEGGIDEGQTQVTLKEGFAESINTVFGKLGAFTVGPKALENFAQRFHFNQPIEFEMPVQASQFSAPAGEDPYRLAELASGFNRTTTVSPLHGAMLASAIVNEGCLMEPSIAKDVFDLDNTIYYQREAPVSLGPVVSPSTVAELRKLMRATITQGTGRKSFRDAATHPVLSRLDIGGKTGSIDNDAGNRVDWFVSYAVPTERPEEAIALATVVVHGEKMGIRSREIVREAIIQYYAPRLGSKRG